MYVDSGCPLVGASYSAVDQVSHHDPGKCLYIKKSSVPVQSLMDLDNLRSPQRDFAIETCAAAVTHSHSCHSCSHARRD